MNPYENAIKEIERSDYGYSHLMDDANKAYHNGAIGQIAIANAIRGLTEEYKRRTDLMEGFYSVAVKVADTLEKIETNLDGLNECVDELKATIYYKG